MAKLATVVDAQEAQKLLLGSIERRGRYDTRLAKPNHAQDPVTYDIKAVLETASKRLLKSNVKKAKKRKPNNEDAGAMGQSEKRQKQDDDEKDGINNGGNNDEDDGQPSSRLKKKFRS